MQRLASAARYSMQEPAQTCALMCAFDANIVERWSALTFCVDFRVMHCSKVCSSYDPRDPILKRIGSAPKIQPLGWAAVVTDRRRGAGAIVATRF